MSIFVRPVREQLEHDRLIRHLQAKYKRKFDVGANLGDEQTSPLKVGTNTFYPDLVLSADERVVGIVEVETGESVNNLEAMAQWVHFSRSRAPFYLYVPVPGYDTTRRLCEALNVKPAEIWTYRSALDSFDLVRMHHDASVAEPRPAGKVKAAASGGKKAPARAAKKAAKKAVKKAAKKAVKKAAKKAGKKTAKKVAGKARAAGARGKKAAKPARKAKAARPARALAGKKR